MKTLLFAVVISLFAYQTEAQNSKKRSDKRLGTVINTWREGSITLTDQTEIKGLVKYDDKNGVLSYQNGDESRTFIAKSVLAFKFYDEATAHDRVFYSLDFSDPDVGYSKMYFFEVIREYEKFAILSKTDPFEVHHKTTSNASGYGYYETSTYSQTSTIFFMDNQGLLVSYIQQIDGNKPGNGPFAFDQVRNKLLTDKDTFAAFIGTEKFEQLEEFAKKQDLQFKIKEDFIKIVDYYDHLLASNP